MASPPTIQRDSQADWALMTAIHDALRRDLDQLRCRSSATSCPLPSSAQSPGAIRGGPAECTLPWALAHASPHICTQVLRQLPAPSRLLYRKVWLPRFTRNIPPL